VLRQESAPLTDPLQLSRLLAGGTGNLYQFFFEDEVNLDRVDFDPCNIHTVQSENGLEIEDIVTQEDSESRLKLCLELTFDLTGKDNLAVYFLVACGGKTIMSCPSLTAQIYGRRQDRI
jgi:CRISPR-associated protein (TIGR02584 family)